VNDRCDTENYRMSYQITIEDIRFLKMQQWRVTYYVIILIAAIAGFYRVLHDMNGIVCPAQRSMLLCCLNWGVSSVGCFLLLIFQFNLRGYRSSLTETAKNLRLGVKERGLDVTFEWLHKKCRFLGNKISNCLFGQVEGHRYYTSIFKDGMLTVILIASMFVASYCLRWLP
jgi:hypothetical protein